MISNYEPFVSDGDKRSTTIDLDHQYTVQELHDLGLTFYVPVTRHAFHLPLWLFPGTVFDHDDPHEPDRISAPRNQFWGPQVRYYEPAKFFAKRGYHENCQTCCAKNHFYRFRLVVYALLAALALTGLCILAWQNFAWFGHFFMLIMDIGMIVFLVLAMLALVWVVTIPGF
jgi:hypothetical protein